MYIIFVFFTTVMGLHALLPDLLSTPSNLLKPSKRLQRLSYQGNPQQQFHGVQDVLHSPDPPFLELFLKGDLGTRLVNTVVLVTFATQVKKRKAEIKSHAFFGFLWSDYWVFLTILCCVYGHANCPQIELILSALGAGVAKITKTTVPYSFRK